MPWGRHHLLVEMASCLRAFLLALGLLLFAGKAGEDGIVTIPRLPPPQLFFPLGYCSLAVVAGAVIAVAAAAAANAVMAVAAVAVAVVARTAMAAYICR
jgi:hypothetical protein